MTGDVQPGHSFPLGASAGAGGVNFSVFSRSSARVELLLFDRVDDDKPARVVALDPARHRTYHYWHARAPHVEPGHIYGYRAIGAFEPERGLRFDPEKVLLDPYGRAVAYCQDDETSWLDWTGLDRHADIHRFARRLIHRRRQREAPWATDGLSLSQLLDQYRRHARVAFHGIKLGRPDWASHSHSLAFTVRNRSGNRLFHLMLNAYWEALVFELPPLADPHRWRRWLDTAQPSPEDVVRS